MAPGGTDCTHTKTHTPACSPLSADEGSESVSAKEGGRREKKR